MRLKGKGTIRCSRCNVIIRQCTCDWGNTYYELCKYCEFEVEKYGKSEEEETREPEQHEHPTCTVTFDANGRVKAYHEEGSMPDSEHLLQYLAAWKDIR